MGSQERGNAVEQRRGGASGVDLMATDCAIPIPIERGRPSKVVLCNARHAPRAPDTPSNLPLPRRLEAGRRCGRAGRTPRLRHNSVRQHLRAAGRDRPRQRDNRTTRRAGRPRLRYTINAAAAERWGITGPYERLTLLLTEIIRSGDSPVDLGRRAGRAQRDEAGQRDRHRVGRLPVRGHSVERPRHGLLTPPRPRSGHRRRIRRTCHRRAHPTRPPSRPLPSALPPRDRDPCPDGHPAIARSPKPSSISGSRRQSLSPRLWHHRDGARGVLDATLADRAEQQTSEPPASSRADHEQVSCLGSFEQDLRR